MKTKIISSNRDLIIKIIENETCCKARYDLSPSFSCHIGGYTITRDGFIYSDVSNSIFPLLGSLGLCDHPFPSTIPLDNDIYYPSIQHDGSSLSKLFYIIYSRQHLLNRFLKQAKYLKSSSSEIDNFHIIQVIERSMRKYIDTVKKRYQKKLNEEREEKNYLSNRNYKTRKDPVMNMSEDVKKLLLP